ncbi:Uncharacterised protein [Mycobacteroides abscessus subsp. abscessus]|nr:Uncharacterised protein [Mycobacteroides abscessus subsp. abscessus]
MLASMFEPMPTTACGKSGTPNWASASASVVSTAETWVNSSAYCCTTAGLASSASTSVPWVTSSRASALPNRPSPITTTRVSGLRGLPDNGALLR